MTETKLQGPPPGSTRWIYLISYNLFQCLGWGITLLLALSYYAEKQTYIGVYSYVSFYLLFFQSLQCIEILHSLFGLVRSPFFTTFIQIGSRIMVIWGVLYPVPEVNNQISVSMLIVAWCIAEIVRYSFYATALIGSTPYFIQFLRYNLFLILYPVGITGEVITAIAALPYISERQILSISLPNCYNISFQFSYYTVFILLSYLPGFPILFSYMLKQRKNFLYPDKEKKV